MAEGDSLIFPVRFELTTAEEQLDALEERAKKGITVPVRTSGTEGIAPSGAAPTAPPPPTAPPIAPPVAAYQSAIQQASNRGDIAAVELLRQQARSVGIENNLTFPTRLPEAPRVPPAPPPVSAIPTTHPPVAPTLPPTVAERPLPTAPVTPTPAIPPAATLPPISPFQTEVDAAASRGDFARVRQLAQTAATAGIAVRLPAQATPAIPPQLPSNAFQLGVNAAVASGDLDTARQLAATATRQNIPVQLPPEAAQTEPLPREERAAQRLLSRPSVAPIRESVEAVAREREATFGESRLEALRESVQIHKERGTDILERAKFAADEGLRRQRAAEELAIEKSGATPARTTSTILGPPLPAGWRRDPATGEAYNPAVATPAPVVGRTQFGPERPPGFEEPRERDVRLFKQQQEVERLWQSVPKEDHPTIQRLGEARMKLGMESIDALRDSVKAYQADTTAFRQFTAARDKEQKAVVTSLAKESRGREQMFQAEIAGLPVAEQLRRVASRLGELRVIPAETLPEGVAGPPAPARMGPAPAIGEPRFDEYTRLTRQANVLRERAGRGEEDEGVGAAIGRFANQRVGRGVMFGLIAADRAATAMHEFQTYQTNVLLAGRDQAKQLDVTLAYRQQLIGSVPFAGEIVGQLQDPGGFKIQQIRATQAAAAAAEAQVQQRVPTIEYRRRAEEAVRIGDTFGGKRTIEEARAAADQADRAAEEARKVQAKADNATVDANLADRIAKQQARDQEAEVSKFGRIIAAIPKINEKQYGSDKQAADEGLAYADARNKELKAAQKAHQETFEQVSKEARRKDAQDLELLRIETTRLAAYDRGDDRHDADIAALRGEQRVRTEEAYVHNIPPQPRGLLATIRRIAQLPPPVPPEAAAVQAEFEARIGASDTADTREKTLFRIAAQGAQQAAQERARNRPIEATFAEFSTQARLQELKAQYEKPDEVGFVRSANQAQYQALVAQTVRQVATQNRQQFGEIAQTSIAAETIQQVSNLRAQNLPVEAERARIQGERRAALQQIEQQRQQRVQDIGGGIAGFLLRPGVEIAALAERAKAFAETGAQQSDFDRQRAQQGQFIDINLTGRARQVKALLDRAPTLAEAQGIVAQTQTEELQLRLDERPDKAEERRKIGLSQLALTRQDFLESFKGVQVSKDFAAALAFGPSNKYGEDPGKILQGIQNAQTELGKPTLAKEGQQQPASKADFKEVFDAAIDKLTAAFSGALAN